MTRKRFMLGNFTAAGAEILDGHNMSVAYLDASTEEEAQRFVDLCNTRHERRVKFDQEQAELSAQLRAHFKGRRFGDAA